MSAGGLVAICAFAVIALLIKSAAKKSPPDRTDPNVRAAFRQWADGHGVRADAILSAAPARMPAPDAAMLKEFERLRPYRESEVLHWHYDLAGQLGGVPASAQDGIALQMTHRSVEVAHMLRLAYPGSAQPTHEGFRRLAINAEKLGQHAKAIEWCQQAQSEGWAGDWAKRIERCQVKAEKAALKVGGAK